MDFDFVTKIYLSFTKWNRKSKPLKPARSREIQSNHKIINGLNLKPVIKCK